MKILACFICNNCYAAKSRDIFKICTNCLVGCGIMNADRWRNLADGISKGGLYA